MSEIKKGRLVEPLATKYRPKTIDDLVGQDSTVKRFKGIIKSGSIPAAIALLGPSGVGKTTTARIIARTLNCEHGTACGDCNSCKLMDRDKHPDYSECNAGDEGGVDAMRALIQKAKLNPTVSALRILVIDEAQAISKAGQMALLKPIEQPASRTLWIIGSMSPDKLDPAILNRCQTFKLNLVDKESLARRLAYIASEEGYELEDEIFDILAELSSGHARAAIQYLEMVTQFVAGLDKKPKNLTELIKREVIQGTLVDSDEQLAAQLILFTCSGNLKKLHATLLDSQSHVSLVSKVLYMCQYVLSRVMGVDEHKNLWHTPVNKTCWDMLCKLVAKLEANGVSEAEAINYLRGALLDVAQGAVACRDRLTTVGGVPEIMITAPIFEKIALQLKNK